MMAIEMIWWALGGLCMLIVCLAIALIWQLLTMEKQLSEEDDWLVK